MKYDIIIAGGGTAGCACAYTAGKLGLKTLVIEKQSCLGGTMTTSLVTPAMSTKTNQFLNNDFFEKLMDNLKNMGGQITYLDGNIGWFNPELMKIALDKMFKDANVDVLFNTCINDVVRNKERIVGVTLDTKIYEDTETIYNDNLSIKNKGLLEYIETKYLIDATGDAKIFEKINLEFLNDKNNYDEYQPVNLRFIMSGINISEFSDWITKLDSDRSVTTSYKINGEIHLSTAYTWDKKETPWALEPVFRDGIEEGLITEGDSNYFQAFTVPGMPNSVAFNCPRILKCLNPSNKPSLSLALIEGRESILRISNFLKAKFKGFEESYVSSIASTLGIRVSKRIKGKYVYTIDDIRSGKKFTNPVLISKYPVDVHSDKNGQSLLEKQDKEYMLPVESLISEKYDNLFAIGRCISADFLSQAALRVIPSCFSMGEGLAKYIKDLEL